MSNTIRLSKPKKKEDAFCHTMIRDIAREMAAEAWDELAQDDKFYCVAKENGLTQDIFIEKSWAGFVQEARRALAALLAEDSAITEEDRDKIFEALMLDASLIRNGRDANGRLL
jgi:hypothetical protein